MRILDLPVIHPAGGMTLVEVVIAIAIAGLVSIGMYASGIYTLRQTARNLEHIYALQLVNSAAAKVRAARFDLLTADESDVPAEAFEKQFFKAHTIATDPNQPAPTTYTLTYKLKGYGKGVTADAAGGSGKHYNLVQPEDSAAVTKNEYKDHLLVITGGEGANQVRYIVMNNATKVNGPSGERTVRVKLATNFDGTGADAFDKEPNAGSMYALDYGIYCDITVTWGNGSGHRSITETVYVPTS